MVLPVRSSRRYQSLVQKGWALLPYTFIESSNGFYILLQAILPEVKDQIGKGGVFGPLLIYKLDAVRKLPLTLGLQHGRSNMKNTLQCLYNAIKQQSPHACLPLCVSLCRGGQSTECQGGLH